MTSLSPPDLGLALHQSLALIDAPEALVQQALTLFQRQPVGGAAASGWRRLVARMSFDSGTPGLAATVRHGQADTRQLLFEASGREVELRITALPGSDHWQLSGQVLGPEESGWASLSTEDGYTAQSTWSDLTEFSFDDVPPGPCLVVIRGGDWEVFLPDLRIPRDM